MTSEISWVLLPTEIGETVVSVICIGTAVVTVIDAKQTLNRVIESGQNHGSDIFARSSVRNKIAILWVGIIGTLLTLDRVQLLLTGYVPDLWIHFLVFGLLRTGMVVLSTHAAWRNMKDYRQLRQMTR